MVGVSAYVLLRTTTVVVAGNVCRHDTLEKRSAENR